MIRLLVAYIFMWANFDARWDVANVLFVDVYAAGWLEFKKVSNVK